MGKKLITLEMLEKEKACSRELKIFAKHFPNGAMWSDDIAKCDKIDLCWGWAVTRFLLSRTVRFERGSEKWVRH